MGNFYIYLPPWTLILLVVVIVCVAIRRRVKEW